MKIKKIEAWKQEIQLEEPYAVAYGWFEAADNVFIRIETDSGLTGFGCASPDVEVSGETGETVLRAFNDVVLPLLKGEDPLRTAFWYEKLNKSLREQPSARALVDMALYDLLAKQAGVPLYKLLGGYRDSIYTSITIGIMPVKETVEKALAFVKKGFRAIKIKGGSDVDMDIEKVLKVREAVGDDIQLRYDANQGYTVEEARKFFEGAHLSKIKFMEQPAPRGNPETWRELVTCVHWPLMADESIMDVRDMSWFIKQGIVVMMNVKLMKCGGISDALIMDGVAQAEDIVLMIGCMDEAALGISAGLHLALARPSIKYADLDGHFDLKNDPTAGAVIFKDGKLYPSPEPGLGIKQLSVT